MRCHAPMDPKFIPLADYNGEVAWGIAHAPERDAKMAVLQAEFDAGRRGQMIADGGFEWLPGTWIIPADPLDGKRLRGMLAC